MPPIKDHWENDTGEMEINGSLVEWTGRGIFYERWASDDANGDAEDAELRAEMQGLERASRESGARLRPGAFCPYVSVSRVSLLPGDLVLQDILERNVVDDLTGKPIGCRTGHFCKT